MTKKKYNRKGTLAFIRYVINPSSFEVPEMDEKDWERLFRFSRRHTILGFVFEGVHRLEEQGVKVPQHILKEWVAYTLIIEKKNRSMNHVVAKLYQKVSSEGFRCCILKGQGNNLMYPNMFCRTPGDIDLWMASVGEKQPDVRKIIQYVRSQNRKGKAIYHHIVFGDFEGVNVEVHYRPSFMNNPIHNYRLQKWFTQQADAQFKNCVDLPGNAGIIAMPTPEFNAVYQLVHIYNHLLNKGMRMRQIIDYYYVVLAVKDKQELHATLHYLGLEKIAGALMWCLHNMLGMDEQHLIVAMDEQRGRVVYNEIMSVGKFGKKGPSKGEKTGEKKPLWQIDVKKNVQRLYKDIRMVRYFPSECLFEPMFRLYHFFWRMVM